MGAPSFCDGFNTHHNGTLRCRREGHPRHQQSPEAQKSRYSAIDGRTTRHQGYALSIKHRKRIEEAFGWAKTVGGMAQTVYRSVERVRSHFILTMAANNLARLPRLLAA
tara:strand:- start:1922 stop:2248 length:327 start_codon:yes stop_codon:yes gene_type:complete